MDQRQKPDYIATTVVDTAGGQPRWREVGVAFVNEASESITVLLDAVPVTGKLVLTKPKARIGISGEAGER